MCGICGFNWNNKELIKSMMDEMFHRGPDQNGIYSTNDISLGHRRLSIIDLSEDGRQPMSNEDGSIQLVYNGEIYNFIGLREELMKRGHRFISQSDSEVIIHAYEEDGIDCVKRFNGMFAFAIWDQKEKSLLLVRDRIGIKPLYYYYKDGRFVFASEIKAILKDREVVRELNPEALYYYLGFEFVPAPGTMFKYIYKLPAGHYLLLKDGRLEVKQYWDLKFSAHNGINISPKDIRDKELEHIEKAVKSHLVSDVPLGVFLSGGLDSSAIVAMMRRHITGPLRTFTIGYPDKSFSELDYAKKVSEYFATEHHVLMIDSVTKEDIEKVLWHLDEPMTDLSTIPLFLICKMAKREVTVCLSGEGGDESFAGYDRFKASKADKYYRLIPSVVRRYLIGEIIRRLPDQPQKKGMINIAKRFVEGSNLPLDGGHLRWQYFSNEGQDSLLYNDTFKNKVVFDPFLHVRDYSKRSNTDDRINREIYVDMRFVMPESVLMKVDKMSMANSLEIRVPFLDHEFVEFNASLPGRMKLKGFKTKYILRSSLKGILPDNIVNRGKQGYSLPVKNLLRNHLREYMVELLNDSPLIKENLNISHVNQLIKEHLEGTHNHNHILWALMSVANWHNNFF